MPTFQYTIKTSNGEAHGSIEADNSDSARKQLTDQYVPKDHGFVDKAGKKTIKHDLVDIEINQVG